MILFKANKKQTRNWAGFTLLESLFALFINSLVLLLVSSLFTAVYTSQRSLNEEKNTEWHLFLNQVEYDLSDKKLIARQRQYVEFQEKQTTAKIAYEFQKQEIVRKKDGSGYAPLLTGLRDILYQDAPGGFTIQASFGNGQVMKGYVSVDAK